MQQNDPQELTHAKHLLCHQCQPTLANQTGSILSEFTYQLLNVAL
jgi:hypothetical protein